MYPRELRVRVSEAMYQRIIKQAAMREFSLSAMTRIGLGLWLNSAEKR